VEADIVTDDPGPANIQKQHVATFKWTPAKATIGIGMGKEMYSIIQQAFAAQQKPFDGALHVTDLNDTIQSSLNFTGGIMTLVARRAGSQHARIATNAQHPDHRGEPGDHTFRDRPTCDRIPGRSWPPAMLVRICGIVPPRTRRDLVESGLTWR